MKSILDRSFRYQSSVQTDLKKTFAKIRREQRKREKAKLAQHSAGTQKILPIRAQRTHEG